MFLTLLNRTGFFPVSVVLLCLATTMIKYALHSAYSFHLGRLDFR